MHAQTWGWPRRKGWSKRGAVRTLAGYCNGTTGTPTEGIILHSLWFPRRRSVAICCNYFLIEKSLLACHVPSLRLIGKSHLISMPSSISSASGWIPKVLHRRIPAEGCLMGWGKGSRLPEKPVTKGRAQYVLGLILRDQWTGWEWDLAMSADTNEKLLSSPLMRLALKTGRLARKALEQLHTNHSFPGNCLL